MKLHTKTLLTALTASTALAAGSAQAETVLIDFSTANVAASPDATNGNYWNSLGDNSVSGDPADITVNDLLLSDNSGNSPWDISVDHFGVNVSGTIRSGFGGTGIEGPIGSTTPFDVTGDDRPTRDGIYASSGEVFITLSGLVANTDYTLEMAGGRTGGAQNIGLIELLTGSAVSGLDGSNQATLAPDGTVLSITATATAGGEISFGFEVPLADNNRDTTLNAMSITGAVPEPGSLALLGLGGLLIARRRRG